MPFSHARYARAAGGFLPPRGKTHPAPANALVGGYARAVLGADFFVGAVILIGLRAANTKGEPPGGTPAEITGVAIPGEVNGTSQPRTPGRERV